MGDYEPTRHIAELRIPIEFVELPGDMTGRWRPEHGRLELQTGMGLIQVRSVLAHEIVHIEHDDRPTRLTKLKIEHTADVIAANRLIDVELLGDLQAWRPDSPDAWCRELRVTPHLLGVKLHELAREQRSSA